MREGLAGDSDEPGSMSAERHTTRCLWSGAQALGEVLSGLGIP